MPPSLGDLNVALAHWHVRGWGGAEYLVTQLAEALAIDRVFTIGHPSPARSNPYGDVEWVDVLGSLSPRPLRRVQARAGRVFEYALWEDVDWREFGGGDSAPDIIVSSGSTTRAIITPDDTLHVNYCHSPPRWFYDLYHDRKDSITGVLARPLLRHLRARDVTIDPRVDHYLANSPIIERRLWKYYKRDAEVLYPPVDLDSYREEGDHGFYLHLGRLDEEKGVQAVVDAFADGESNLVLAGGRGDVGDQVLARVRDIPNIEYRGFVSETEKRTLLATCRALVFNGRNEDFGIVPIEAAASGKAVLARNEGFPATFIEPGETGYLHDGTADGIAEAVTALNNSEMAGGIERNLDAFALDSFRSRLRDRLQEWYTALGHPATSGL